MASVSVIIVNYNVKHYIEQCLNSLLRSVPDAQIIVVDNNSKDGSADYLRERFPMVNLIANSENVGFGRANNMALQYAEGRYVLFLNPDTVVAERTIPYCVEYMDSHPDIGSAGVRMLYGDGRFAFESRRALPTPKVAFWHMTGLGRFFPKSRVFARYHMTYEDPMRDCDIDVVSGAFMFVRKSVLDRVGGFDEAFFMYGEDIDLSYRILMHGYKNRYLPVPIIHYKGESTIKTTYSYAKVFYDAMMIFYNKHFRRSSRFLTPFVKMAVGLKKIGTFLGQNLFYRHRMSADYSQKSLFIGRKEIFPNVVALAGKSSYLKDVSFVEGSKNIHADINVDNIQAVIFDIEVFSFDTLLDWINDMACSGRRITMGLYSSKTGRLITETEVL